MKRTAKKSSRKSTAKKKSTKKVIKRRNPATDGALRRWVFLNIHKYIIVVPKNEVSIFPSPSPFVESIDSENLALDFLKNQKFDISSDSKINAALRLLIPKINRYVSLWETIFNSEKSKEEKNKLWKLYMIQEPVIAGY